MSKFLDDLTALDAKTAKGEVFVFGNANQILAAWLFNRRTEIAEVVRAADSVAQRMDKTTAWRRIDSLIEAVVLSVVIILTDTFIFLSPKLN